MTILGKFAQTVIKNTFLINLFQFISKISGFIFILIATNHLGPSEFGRFSFVLALTSFFYVLTNLGLFNIEIREQAKNLQKFHIYLTGSLLIKLFLSSVAAVVLIITVNFIDFTSKTSALIYLIGFSVIVEAIYHSFASTFMAHEKMLAAGLLSFGTNIIKNILGTVLLALNYALFDIAASWLLVSILSVLIAFIAIHKFLPSMRFEIDMPTIRFMLKESWPLAISALVFVGYWRFDTLLLAHFKDYQQVGWYSAAYRIWDAMLIIPTSFIAAFLPSAAKIYKNSVDSFNDIYRKAIKSLVLVTLPLALLIFLLAGWIPRVLGDGFEGSVLALRILVWALPLFSLRLLFMQVLNISNRQINVMYSDIFALSVNLLLNLIFIPKLGFIAPAIIMIISEAAAISLMYYSLNIAVRFKKPYLTG